VSQVDLHIHSNASDGRLSPGALVKMAAELGLKYLALTDHDSVAGIPSAIEAARAFPQLTFIPGVEISTDVPEGEVHILGYFIDYASPELGRSLERFRDSRQGRAQGMIARLGKLGIDIDWARVQELAGDGSIGRPHIARAMLEKGYITRFEEAFEKYIGHGGPAYVERDKMTPAEAVELVLSARGLPVLAHPFTVAGPEKLVKELKTTGLIGLEAYYKDASREDVKTMLLLAEQYGLIATGGSDYHGIGESTEVRPGGVDVPLQAAESLIALARERSLNTFSMSP
jgi:predicted metal-dependent phosphoesterase TrpH